MLRIDHLDVRAHSRTELDTRRAIPVPATLLRKHVPGFQDAIVADSADLVGVRCTRWIDAGFDLTAEEIAQGRRFDDMIGVVASHDSHPKGGVIHPPYPADLPYRMMLPPGVENLVVASGKSVSTQPRGLVRGQRHCFVLGQAGGVAAAVAFMSGLTPSQVTVRDVQSALLSRTVYLGDPDRLAELGRR